MAIATFSTHVFSLQSPTTTNVTATTLLQPLTVLPSQLLNSLQLLLPLSLGPPLLFVLKNFQHPSFFPLVKAGRSLESFPKDFAAAIEAGKVLGSIANRYLELEKSPVFRWLLQFGGFKERLLAD
ncbi:hypothetical protein NC651_022132 [Populus alba x Populus x berolinensis]|nr:hypothetical protein NC651_022132 [Populus alba x Populus x berolinensis]